VSIIIANYLFIYLIIYILFVYMLGEGILYYTLKLTCILHIYTTHVARLFIYLYHKFKTIYLLPDVNNSQRVFLHICIYLLFTTYRSFWAKLNI